MAEIRQDILTGEWIIIADNRMKRPYDFVRSETPREKGHLCMFCPGNEAYTTPSVFELPDASKKGWEIRVFPNKYPAVSEKALPVSGCFEPYTALSATGLHEIVVDTPNHSEKLHELSPQRLKKVLEVLKARELEMLKKSGFKYIHIFKNNGPKAGASISHSHWQIVALPFLPKEQSDVYANAKSFFEEHNKTVFAAMLEAEKCAAVRMVDENEHFAMFAPYASKFGFELNILSKTPKERFSELSSEKLLSLARLMNTALTGIYRLGKDVCYNIIFNDAPLDKDSGFLHFYVRIIPRLGQLAGFEFGTRGYINQTSPENAAAFYRGEAPSGLPKL
ncbi:MAG: galactose-1-phosphate uridylyltransferase [Firmicutes bacterium]|nr:galactose-1-phosphate uridylyltransferase [Bacillota bacterium]